ncbi:MAG: recombinase family protein [Neisseria animaloris]|nr:recombinase family protein [Neisseria animaloris]
MKKIARLYCRVSTEEQNLERQMELKKWAEERGFYVAKIYAEKASGRTAKRPKLQEMIQDLQSGETVIAENIDRLSRLPLQEAEELIAAIEQKGAKLLLPNVLEPLNTQYTENSMEHIVFSAMQNLLLKILLKSASDDYELRRERQAAGIRIAQKNGKKFGRRVNQKRVNDIVHCRTKGLSIAETAKITGCSESTVKRISRLAKNGTYSTHPV